MTITENNNIVNVNDESIVGFIADEVCPKCASKQVYYEKFDAYFCPQCNVWLENHCSDAKCSYCKDRPAKPLKKN